MRSQARGDAAERKPLASFYLREIEPGRVHGLDEGYSGSFERLDIALQFLKGLFQRKD